MDREQLDDDLALLTQISDLASKLKGPHQVISPVPTYNFNPYSNSKRRHQNPPVKAAEVGG